MAFQPLVINGDLSDLSDNNGYELITSLKLNIRQNLKMLILTNPGERVMEPDFGVGVKRYLFEMNDNQVYSAIENKIREQVKRYLPYLSVARVRFMSFEENANGIKIMLEYKIPRLSLNDALELLL